VTYIGMDVHKQETQVCIEDAEGAVILEQRIRTTRERFTALLGGRPGASGSRSTSRRSGTR
jgi:hypothetical protein